jgi:mRNA interferase RelE/StbE
VNGPFKGFFKNSAEAEFKSLAPDDRQRVRDTITDLCTNPYMLGFCKVCGTDLLRYRVGDYRILYEVDQEHREITIVAVRHRKEVYRKL